MLINTVFIWNEVCYRMIYSRDCKVWLYHMNSHHRYCICIDINELSKAEKDGSIKEIQDPYDALKMRAATPDEIKIGELNYELIKPIIYDPDILFDKEALRKKVKEVIVNIEDDTNLRSKEAKIYRCIMLWWERGQVPSVLMPNYSRKTKNIIYTKKTGKQNSISCDSPPINDEIRAAFDDIYHEFLLVPIPASQKKAYSIFLARWIETHGVTREQAPTENQFLYYYHKKYSSGQRANSQSTKIIQNKDRRPLTGNTYEIAKGPGYIYEIDSSLDNVNLVSNDRKNVVGRPILYTVVDVYSGMIVGFHLSFENAQYKTAADALFIAMSNKVEFCSKYGVEITEDDWPAFGIPAMITADNAELSGEQIEYLSRSYGIQVNNTSSYRGDEKGTVESAIHWLQNSVKNGLKEHGLVIKEGKLLAKAGDKDSRGEASLTIYDYTKILIRSVLASHTRVRLNTPPNFPKNIANTPKNIWQYSISNGNCGLRKCIDPEILRLSLLPHYTGTFSRDGANVLGIRYICKHKEYDSYFIRHNDADRPKGWKIVLDPANISNAWLQPDESNRPLEYWNCILAPTSSHLKDMTLDDALDYIETSKKVRQDANLEHLEILGKMSQAQSKDIEDALKKKPNDNRTTKEKVRNIKNNRAEEIRNQESSNPRMNIKNNNDDIPETTSADDKNNNNKSDDWDYHLTDDVDIDQYLE